MSKKVRVKYMSFVQLANGMLVEQVYLNPEPAFLCFDASMDKKEITEKVEMGGFEIRPINEDPIHKGALPLPSDIEDYGTTADLTKKIKEYMHKYIDLDERNEVLCVAYVFMTWVYDKFSEMPFLRFKGEHGTGKSRAALQIIGPICYKPALCIGLATPAPLFRTAESFKGTIVIDETTPKKSERWGDLEVFLLGRMGRNAYVWRTDEKKQRRPSTVFNTYGPTILAGRGLLPNEALESRCLTVRMAQKKIRENIPLNLSDEGLTREQETLRNKLLLWRLRNYDRVRLNSSIKIPGASYRMLQIATPLLSVPEDEQERDELIKLIAGLAEEQKDMLSFSREGDLIRILHGIFSSLDEKGEVTKSQMAQELSCKAIAQKLREKREEYEKFNISPRRVGGILDNLAFKKEKYNNIRYVPCNAENWERVRELAQKYGIELEKEES